VKKKISDYSQSGKEELKAAVTEPIDLFLISIFSIGLK
jgi:hypothetical protein